MWDLVILGGRVIDGTGSPWFQADIGVTGDRIEAMGRVDSAEARKTVDATGLYVCPGFIDMHSHVELELLLSPDLVPKVSQGVTLEIVGQDGLSVAPIADEDVRDLVSNASDLYGDRAATLEWTWRTTGQFLDRIDRRIATNVAMLIPHGNLRRIAAGLEDRPVTNQELQEMLRLLRDGLRDGAVGLSTGLGYAPCMYADQEELVTLCECLLLSGGYFAPHHRSYGVGALDAYRECIEVATHADVPVHLTHATLLFDINRNRADELLGLIDGARGSGVEVTLDTYPYTAAVAALADLLPRWALDGGTERIRERLRDQEVLERVRRHMEEIGTEGFQGMRIDWGVIVPSNAREEHHRGWVGKTFEQIARGEGRPPFDCFVEALNLDGLRTPYIEHTAFEENVREIMRHPAHMVGSDGELVGEMPHPRGWGTFPRYLGHYVRELGTLSWEDAVRKMTSLPAQRLGFRDRGLLRPGMAADVVCFDPETVADRATYEEPKQLPEGIPYVLVNGQLVIDDYIHTGALPGRALRRSSTGRTLVR